MLPAWNSESPRSPISARASAPSSACATSWRRSGWPTSSASTCSPSASTTARTSSSPRRPSRWPRRPSPPSASASRARSPCSAPTIRSASSRTSPRSTCSPAAAPRSWPAAARSSSPSRSSATTSRTTTSSTPRSSTCCCRLRDDVHVTWAGRHRAPLDNAGVWPRPAQEQLPVWVAVGGSPQSIVRAGTLGLPLVLAIIGGQPERFVPLVDLYREAAQAAGHEPEQTQGRDQHARLRRRDLRAGRRRLRRALPGDDEPHRARARLAALGPGGVRGAALAARRGGRGLARAGRREDPLRARALRPPALHRRR